MKSDADVIKDFKEAVNMTADELREWLETKDSKETGWTSSGEGEAVGHQSGRRIVEILDDNPSGDEDKYTQDHLDHMRRVAAYCKRHLAQEGQGNKDKDDDELRQTKSYKSLKNWGHDPIKARSSTSSSSASKSAPSKSSKKEDSKEEETDDAADETEETSGTKRASPPAADEDADETSEPAKKKSKTANKDKEERKEAEEASAAAGEEQGEKEKVDASEPIDDKKESDKEEEHDEAEAGDGPGSK